MRDDRHKWPAPAAADARLPLDGAELTEVMGLTQVLVSGPSVLGSIDMPIVGWPDPATGDRYALALRRDRVLLINGPALAPGWDSAAMRAVSDISDAYAVFDLTGPRAFDTLRYGTEISRETPSRSVMRRLFGLEIALYAYQGPDQFRLHVPRAFREAFLDNLQAMSQFR